MIFYLRSFAPDDFTPEASINSLTRWNDELLVSPAYKGFLMQFVFYQHAINQQQQPKDNPCLEWYELAGKVLTGKSKEYAQLSFLKRAFIKQPEQVGAIYAHLSKSSIDPAYKKIAEDLYQRTLNLLKKGNQAPLFSGTGLDGETISITDFRGKVVLIDVWATWCGWCLGEMPYMKRIKEHFKDRDDLVYLYACGRSKEDQWKALVAKKELDTHPQNVNLYIGEEKDHPLLKSFTGGIPRYIIIGPDGTVLNPKARRPSGVGEEGIIYDKEKGKYISDPNSTLGVEPGDGLIKELQTALEMTN